MTITLTDNYLSRSCHFPFSGAPSCVSTLNEHTYFLLFPPSASRNVSIDVSVALVYVTLISNFNVSSFPFALLILKLVGNKCLRVCIACYLHNELKVPLVYTILVIRNPVNYLLK